MKWKCYIPGKKDTDWDSGYFPLTMEFTEDYPAKPPKVGSAASRTVLGVGRQVFKFAADSCCLAVQVPFGLLPPKHLSVRNSVLKHPE